MVVIFKSSSKSSCAHTELRKLRQKFCEFGIQIPDIWRSRISIEIFIYKCNYVIIYIFLAFFKSIISKVNSDKLSFHFKGLFNFYMNKKRVLFIFTWRCFSSKNQRNTMSPSLNPLQLKGTEHCQKYKLFSPRSGFSQITSKQ